ncbi:NUDIX hydrolase [Oceaniferula spumae]|uniref:8-oxo-dGTP diphosphatase n=1 Tax=Oceaniferula spumae TaxID=2979115 RepID=A0AAT9FRH4_9BACT
MINVVCAVLENAEGKVLACKRPEGKALAGKWEFPGGKVELNEEARDALHREIAEELGCSVRVGDSLTSVEHHYPSFSIRLMPFRCELVAGTPEPREHTELRWVKKKDLPSLDWAEADVPIWQELIS